MKRKGFAPLLACLLLLTACGPKEVVEPSMDSPAPEAPGQTQAPAAEIQAPEPSLEPVVDCLEPPDSVCTLAGVGLVSALLSRSVDQVDFAQDENAGLDELFQSLGFDVKEPCYRHLDPDGSARMELWYDADTGSGVGIRWASAGPALVAHGFGFEETVGAEDDRAEIYWNHWEGKAGEYETLLESEQDELGRVSYQRRYITHGSLDYYYIYDGEAQEPAWCLRLDDNHGHYFPEFVRF